MHRPDEPVITPEKLNEHLLDVRRAHIAHTRWLRAARTHLPPEMGPALRDLDAAFRAVITAVERCTGCRSWNGA